ncbi:dienelactone hydrolase family protein [Clostridium sp. BNL1100]|uniref:dienelactone hydrolase family protein n=1 Tax=Clostridium sp. BNL1100 TaxID=755731 RepID=UPI00024A7EC0|nr:dienelactone hydrolase family protein [Clostridium sp. BNL1100]AEY64542.1 dienelactone hydrolase-like enzyme [Clostridium sp. BNL1100]
MLSIINNSKDLIILIHEIYGVNRFITDTANRFALYGCDVVCPDLCGLGHPFDYSEQEAAYRYFSDNIGFCKGTDIVINLAKQLESSYNRIFLIGFSIGATTAWLCSESGLFSGVICCYGSRIRDYTGISPSCPALLLFPSHEKAFNVRDFVSSIKKPGVKVHTLEGNHGFADSYSMEYHKDSARKAFDLIKGFIE